MRFLEMLLLVADLLGLVALSVPRLRAMQWMPPSATAVLMMISAAQLLVEGPRWQMWPAYGLTGLLVLVSLRSTITADGRNATSTRSRRVACGLGACGLVISTAMPMLIPVFRFPQPTGPFRIGTLTYHWVDAARSEVFTADPKVRRQLMVQIWYPAMASPAAPRAAYMPEADEVTKAFARIHNKPAFVFAHFKYVRTNAMVAARVAADQSRYPVLLFLEGASGFRQMNTFQVEELVSHGYIVVAIDQPGAAANVVFPNDHQTAGLTVTQFHDTIGPSYRPELASSSDNGLKLPNGRTLKDASIVPYLAKDVTFSLDQLADLNQRDPDGILTGKLDLQRVGAFGVSLGGIIVGEACRQELRLKACLVMDAPMSTETVKAGLHQPTMWITQDVASMRLERQRAGGWSEVEIEAHQTTMRAVYEGLSGPGYFVRVPGMFHSNFLDVPNWTPLAAPLGLAGPIGGQRGHDIINAYSLAFFDLHLLGRQEKLLSGLAQQYPEVIFESRLP